MVDLSKRYTSKKSPNSKYKPRFLNYSLAKGRLADLRACYFPFTGENGGPSGIVDLSAGASSKIVEILVEGFLLSRPNGDWVVPGDGGDDDASEDDQMGGEESPGEVTSVCRTNFEEMADRLSQTLPSVRLQQRKQRRNEIHCEGNTTARERSKGTNECAIQV